MKQRLNKVVVEDVEELARYNSFVADRKKVER
jgi:hypothetical protein